MEKKKKKRIHRHTKTHILNICVLLPYIHIYVCDKRQKAKGTRHGEFKRVWLMRKITMLNRCDEFIALLLPF